MNVFINQRVKDYIDYREIKPADFAREIGLNSDRISKWFTKKEKIPAEHLITILQKYKDINARWLLTGDGSMVEGKAYAEAAESHESNSDDGGGGYACTNPGCKKEIALLNKIISQQEETIELYRRLGKKESGIANSA